MSLRKFLYDLQYEPDKARPADFEADWEDAPLPYKLYRGLPAIGLSAEIPLTLENCPATVRPNLQTLGHLLWFTYGLTQISHSCMGPDYATPYDVKPMLAKRRFVPSGGALYPSELYVYVNLSDLPAGVYHYDAAHHRLVMLRQGNFDAYLARALGNRCDISSCFCTLFVSTMFWKNFFKYHNFAYRLQGLDAGVVIGQLLEVANRYGYQTCVYFQFLDRAVNHLLGLSEREESVYAVIPLSAEQDTTWFAGGDKRDAEDTAVSLCRELPEISPAHFVRSKRILPYPLLLKANQASMQESAQLFRPLEKEEEILAQGETIPLSRMERFSYDLASACRKRFSPEMDFFFHKITQYQLAVLFKEATASFAYRNDLDEEAEQPVPRISLYACLHRVEAITDGAYRYDSKAHALQKVRTGDHRFRLQQALSLENVNLFQVPLCLHLVGDREHHIPALGYRGYRIQQMEAGMLVQRLLLITSALGWGGHPLLGFDAKACDEIYQLDFKRKTTLIQILVGPIRPRPHLQGGLHI